MLHIEGMEITRGTKNIIQESIDSINSIDKNNRNAICQEFCRIVEDRYTGGAMGYQLKRMGNSYPIEFLTKNAWSIQDALDNDLLVYLNENWFSDKNYTAVDDKYYYVERLAVTSKPGTVAPVSPVDADTKLFLDNLDSFNLDLVSNMDDFHPEKVKLVDVLMPVSNDQARELDQKVYWLNNLVRSENETCLDDVLNFSKKQAKAKGLLVAITASVKIPLSTTAPILEAIDKYLYDTTGEYQM